MRVRHRDRGGRPPIADQTRNVTVAFDADAVAALDTLADLRDTTRSDLIREAVHGLLTADPEGDANG